MTAFSFPDYSRAERMIDAVVHMAGVPLGVFAAVALVIRAAPHGALTLAGVGIYVAGLIGMLGASAVYQLWR